MKRNNPWIWSIGLVLLLALVASACAPAAAPTPTPTKPPAVAATPTPAAPTPTPAPPTPTPAPPTPTPAPPTPTPKPATVRVGALPGSVAAGPIHIAIAKGYYKELGLDVEVIPFQTGAMMVAPLAGGELEVGAGSISTALFNAIERGVALKIVATKSTTIEGFDYAWLAVRKDLIDSGQVKEPKDLKGRKIAVTAIKGGAECIVANLLKQGGLTIKDIELLGMTTPDMVTSFGNKAIDAALIMETALSRAVEQGLAARWPPGASHTIYGGEYQTAVLVFSEQFTKNVDVARRFMVGYVKSMRDYYEAFVKGKNKSEIISILAKATELDPALFEKMGMPYFDPDGKMHVPSMKMDLAYFKEMGYYTGKLEVESIIDTQFTDYAVQQLGPYKK